MKIIQPMMLEKFAKHHANTRKSLSTWKRVVEEATWKSSKDVLKDFPNVKILRNKRARFEILHNAYRLIGEID